MASHPNSRRAALIVIVLAACLLPAVAISVQRAIRSNANDVRDWLPAHYHETRQYREFLTHFGSEDFVVFSWPGCTLDDPRLDGLAEQLRQRNLTRTSQGTPVLLRGTLTGRPLAGHWTH